MSSDSRVVIVGAGHGAGQAAASLRQEGFEGAIDVYGDEPHPPYQRPPLSKAYLSGEQGVEKVYLRPAAFYDSKDIGMHTGVRVESIDPAARTITSSEGSATWDHLILATGTRPRLLPIPGADLAGVHYLRTIADVDGIRAELSGDTRLVIVGGGYIGLEVAAVALTVGANVTVLEMEDRILQRVTTPQMSAFYHQLHSGRGVDIRVNTAASRFEGTGTVSGVVCGNETLAADMVVVGIGVLPNVELAEAAGISCDNGIVVDERCLTNVPNVYAIGDCCNHPNPILGRRLRLESVPNAMEQARVCAANIAGKDKTYASVPWFWSDQYELKLQMLGFSADGEDSVLRGDMAANEFAVFHMSDGKVVAVDAVNCPREFMAAKQMYGKAVDPAKLADPSVEMKELL
ncbi:MAG: FAD-dependent oxidoreductase [Pseudomonadota bacterium]